MPNNCFPYPGNKARHSKWILEHIPEHECYVELFGGAAGVLFNKPRSKIEVYNDLNGDIPHFFRVLRDRGDELQEWLRNVPYSREVHEEWATSYYDGYRPDDDIEKAGRFFTLRYTQFGSKIDGKSGFATAARGSGPPTGSFHTKVEKLHKFRDRLQKVIIESKPAFEIIKQYDLETTLFYADPPYINTDSHYAQDGFNHEKLSRLAKEMDAKIVISYDSIPTHYGDKFNIVSKKSTFAMNQKSGSTDATEHLIMNYDSKGESVMSELGQSGLSAYQ